MKKAQKYVQEKKAVISTLAEESFSNVRTVKAFANEEEETAKYTKENNEVYKVGYRKVFWCAVYGLFSSFFFYGSFAVILVVGAYLCKAKLLTVGVIATFMFYMIQILIQFMTLAHVFGQVMTVRSL
jgi:ABC-type multidrug transport system fused ATPase/permease subunit